MARPQKVVLNGIMMAIIVLNTGVPQGCVLSPMLFSIYTNTIQPNNRDLKWFKYADGRALVAVLNENLPDSEYYEPVENLHRRSEFNSPYRNADKTKEMIIGHPEPLPGIKICG